MTHPGWAEMVIPFQAFEIGKCKLSTPKKMTGPGIPHYAQERPLSILSYHDGFIQMPVFSILTPFLKVTSWDSATGRLDLELGLGTSVATKFQALQDSLVLQLFHSPSWHTSLGASSAPSFQEIKELFQPMVSGGILTIYLHGANPELKQTGRVWIWKDNEWSKGAHRNHFQKGDLLRVALRLQGICFLQPTIKTHRLRYRIQHQTVAIFHRGKGTSTDSNEGVPAL